MAKERIIEQETLILEEFLRNLEHTTEQVHQLLIEINNSKIDLASIKTELKFIVENVKELSLIIRDNVEGNSIITKIALIERDLEKIKEYILKDTNDYINITTKITAIEERLDYFQKFIDLYNKLQQQNKEIDLAKTSGKWKIYAIIATGIVGIIGTIITLLLNLI